MFRRRSGKTALLQKVPLFRVLSDKQIAQIDRLVDEVTGSLIRGRSIKSRFGSACTA